MKNRLGLGPIVAVAAFAAAAGAVQADVILTFGFTDLAGSYSTGSQVFTANAADMGTLRTAGDVSRLDTPGGSSARYNDGFSTLFPGSVVSLSINVSNISANTADGAGSFVVTDVNGDTLHGDIMGTWVRGSLGRTYFNGDLANVSFSNPSNDGTFDGPNGGSFPLNFNAIAPFEGALVELLTRPSGVGFFTGSFSNVSTQISAEIVPAPGAVALLGLGGLLAGRRRR